MSSSHLAGLSQTASPSGIDSALGIGRQMEAVRQLAWQQAMERAQLAAWFKPAPRAWPTGADAACDGAAEAASANDAARGMQGSSGPGRPSGPSAMAVAPAASMQQTEKGRSLDNAGDTSAVPPPFRRTAEGAAVACISSTPPPGAIAKQADALRLPSFDLSRSVGATAEGLVADAAVAAVAAELASPPKGAALEAPRPPTSSTSSPPMRLHAEIWPEGQAVWIAMRADDGQWAAALPQIVAELRRNLQAQGRPLHQVVCNGRLLWRDGAFVHFIQAGGRHGD